MSKQSSLLGWGIGAVAAGTLAVAGVTTDRLLRRRDTAVLLGETGDYQETPDEDLVVIADDGVPLHVEVDHPRGTNPADAAAKPTVVLVHGYTLNLTSWVFQRRALRDAGYRVVLYDQRGHGQSEEGEDSSYVIDQLGRDLRSVLDAAVPQGSVVLVGHSMGGMTIMSFAQQFPTILRERVVGTVFIATSAGGLKDVHWGLGQGIGTIVHRLAPIAMQRLSTREDLVTRALKTGQELEQYIVHHFSFGSHVPLSIVRLTGDMVFATRLHVIGVFLETLMKHDAVASLSQFDGFETLVMVGTKDRLTPPEHSEALVRAIHGAEHVVVEDGGHVLQLEHPELVNEQLLALLGRAERACAVPTARRRGPVRRTVTDVAARRRAQAVRGGKAVRSRASGGPHA